MGGSMELYEEPLYERPIHEDKEKYTQIRLSVSTFRGIEYLGLRKWYQDFDGEWKPSKEGISMELDFDNSRELFAGLVEILSLAEAKDVLETYFKEYLDEIYK
tara:strand:- start:299 stop:607 length:309 start_codon:yes stop_codon:yes gene_type:complete